MAKKYDFLYKLLLIGDSGVGKTCLIIRFAEDNFNSTYISTIDLIPLTWLSEGPPTLIPISFTISTFPEEWLACWHACFFQDNLSPLPLAVCLSVCLSVQKDEKNITQSIDFKVKTIEVEGKKVKLQVWDTAGQERFKTITTAYYRGAMGIILVYDITDEKSYENIQNWMKSIKENASAGVCRMLLGNKCDIESKRKVSRETGEKLAKDHGIRFFETSAKSSINVDESFLSLARDILQKSSKKPGPTGREVKITSNTEKKSSKCVLL